MHDCFYLMNKTAGAVPASFSSLEYLRELNLQKNFLTSLPASLFELEYLEYLFVDFNRITGQIPVGITGLTSLKELQLGHNSKFLWYFMQFSFICVVAKTNYIPKIQDLLELSHETLAILPTLHSLQPTTIKSAVHYQHPSAI